MKKMRVNTNRVQMLLLKGKACSIFWTEIFAVQKLLSDVIVPLDRKFLSKMLLFIIHFIHGQ